MRGYLKQGVRFFIVSAGIVALTSVSVDATDWLRGSQSALGILATTIVTSDCQDGMVMVERPDRTRFCIDQYEVSADTACVYPEPANSVESAANLADSDCLPHSAVQKRPWTQLLQVQAEQICARAGKRLPTAEEWYWAARGTPDSSVSCGLEASTHTTGEYATCVSGAGAFDMVGGVWEWVADHAHNGTIAGFVLPPEGYITQVTSGGLPSVSSSSPSFALQSDYLWSKSVGSFAVMRGGFYGSRNDGGVYALHAATPLDFAAPTVGFRCALSL